MPTEKAEMDAAAAAEIFRNALNYRREHIVGREDAWSASHKSIVRRSTTAFFFFKKKLVISSNYY